MKQRLRARKTFSPTDEPLLDHAIDASVEHLWNEYTWSFRQAVDTFTSTSGTATYELNSDVDTIAELTYGSLNRAVESKPTNRINELYHNLARTGDEVYFYSLYSADENAMTLQLVPTPDGADTFTYRYFRRIDFGDLDAIPTKLHSLILMGAGNYIGTGDVLSQSYLRNLERMILNDKPLKHRRWNMGLDSLQTTRINSRNTLIGSNSTGNTEKPYD